MKKTNEAYQVKSRYNDINWLGRGADSREFVGIDANGRIVCIECFGEYIQENDNIDDYANQHRECIPLAAATELEAKGKLKFVERFIGGMVDGRGGRWNGEYCREGMPEQVLKDLLKANPSKRYVFSHDESGQFQTYFSVWQLASSGKRFKKTK